MKEQIIEFINKHIIEFNIPIEYVVQSNLNGEAGGLFLISKIEQPILAIDGDNYLSDNFFFKNLVRKHFSENCYATIGVRKVPDIHRYANVKVSDSFILEDIVEKPSIGTEFGDLAKMGCYVLSEEFINRGQQFFKDSQGEITTTAGFSNSCLDNKVIRCLEYKGGYLDIGTFDAFTSHLVDRIGGKNGN